MKVYIIAPYPLDHAPSQRFRFEQYLGLLREAGITCRVSSLMTPRMYRILYQRGRYLLKLVYLFKVLLIRCRDLLLSWRYDLLYVHREAFPIGPPLIEVLLSWTRKPIIFDFDDAIYLPNVSSANRPIARYKNPGKTSTIIALSQTVVAGNRYLEAYALRYNPNVWVIPTTIDTERYHPAVKRPQDVPCIGWSGSKTTIEHLVSLGGVLRTICSRYRVRVKVIGDRHFTIPGVPVDAQDWEEASELDALSEIDIGIMPLPDEEWAKGKCGLKALQYMALGIPAVCSPVGVNSEIVQDGVNGFLASTEQEWIEKLLLLIEDPALRQKLGRAARETVEGKYSVKVNFPLYLSVFRETSERGRKNKG